MLVWVSEGTAEETVGEEDCVDREVAADDVSAATVDDAAAAAEIEDAAAAASTAHWFPLLQDIPTGQHLSPQVSILASKSVVIKGLMG